jgi:hypothetical protein
MCASIYRKHEMSKTNHHYYLVNDKGDLKMSYLVCEKRKGSPKIHIEVCRRKCRLVNECKRFKEFVDNLEKKAA